MKELIFGNLGIFFHPFKVMLTVYELTLYDSNGNITQIFLFGTIDQARNFYKTHKHEIDYEHTYDIGGTNMELF